MKHQDKIQISIYDCGSEDVDRLEAEIRKRWTGRLVFTKADHTFTRAFTFNKAIEQAGHPLIFACDADMSMPVNLVEQCNKYISKYSVWFPICFKLNKDAPVKIGKKYGEWLWVGKGMFASTKEQFYEAGCFNTKFVSWGGEDWDLWFRFFRAGMLPIRTRCRGLFHHWHPELKPVGGIKKS